MSDAPRPPRSEPTRAEWLTLVGLTLVFVAAHLRTLAFGFVWDDHAMIGENAYLEGPFAAGLRVSNHAHLGVRYADAFLPEYDSWRPLLFASNYLDRALFGRAEGLPHLTSMLLGVLALWAAHWFLREWGLGARLRVCGAAVLVLHPVSAEVIGYLSGRGDLLAGIAMLAACAALLRGLRAGPSARFWPALAVGFYLLSLSAKEAYLFVPLALAVRALQLRAPRRYAGVLIACAAVALAWWSVRARIAPTNGGQAARAVSGLGPELLQYARVLVMPFDCSVVRPAASSSLLVTALVVAGYGVLLLLALRRRHGRAADILAAASWFAVSLGPSTIAAQVTQVASDRYAFLALLCLPLLAAAWSASWQRASAFLRGTLVALAVLWSSVLAVVGQLQLSTFRDDRALYMNAVNLEPESAGAWFGLGHVVVEAEGCAQAEPLFQRALSLDPRHVRALNNAGVCALRRGDLPEAERAFRRVLELSKGVHPRAWSNLAQIHLQEGKREEACTELERAMQIDVGATTVRALHARFCR